MMKWKEDKQFIENFEIRTADQELYSPKSITEQKVYIMKK